MARIPLDGNKNFLFPQFKFWAAILYSQIYVLESGTNQGIM